MLKSDLIYQINQSVTTSKNYTDLKYNELKSLYDALVEDAPELYNTFKEIADYIASDKSGASAMLSQINNNTSEINVIKQGLPTTVDIVLRSEVSDDTTEEAKEIEINGMKFKIGSATSSDSSATSNEILTLSNTEYTLEDSDGILSLYINVKLKNQNLLIDFEKDLPDYQYKEINEFDIYINDSVNSQVLVKFSENYLMNLIDVVEQPLLSINYDYRLKNCIKTQLVTLTRQNVKI